MVSSKPPTAIQGVAAEDAQVHGVHGTLGPADLVAGVAGAQGAGHGPGHGALEAGPAHRDLAAAHVGGAGAPQGGQGPGHVTRGQDGVGVAADDDLAARRRRWRAFNPAEVIPAGLGTRRTVG